MKKILTITLFYYIMTVVLSFDWNTLDKDHYLLTIRYDDLAPDSIIVEKKDLKNKDKIIRTVEQILNERNAY